MPDVKWIKTGSDFSRTEGTIVTVPTIPPGVYEAQVGMFGPSLHKVADKFEFPYKLYDLQENFLEHLKKTYDATTGNLGILFNGTRGTGKTVTAKLFANMLNLPVIVVKSMGEDNTNLMTYFNSFNFDCIFFFDEFEKQFKEGDSSILQFMDGVYASQYRRVFLLTTNELSVNENLLSRPSRIRYVRQFGNLEEHVVRAYLKDNLKDQNATEDVVSYVDTLTISTIDILKTIVEEVNIHGIDKFLEVKKFFNVKTASFEYRTIRAHINVRYFDRDGNYTIEDFLREKTLWENRYEDSEEMNLQAGLIKDKNKRAEFINDWNKAHTRRASFDYCYMNTDKAWDKLRPNRDIWNEDETVIKVDKENNVVVTAYDEYLYFYFIRDDNKPSLYGRNKTYAYDL